MRWEPTRPRGANVHQQAQRERSEAMARLVGGKAAAMAAAVVATGAMTAVLLARGPAPQRAAASSHAETPLISQDPRADNTDLYAFVSPDRPDTVTIVANYIPLEAPASGPNFG